MSQKSVIVVSKWNNQSPHPSVEFEKTVVFSDLKTVCEHFDWVYNTICRKGDQFMLGDYLVQRLPILRAGGEEKEKKKIETTEESV